MLDKVTDAQCQHDDADVCGTAMAAEGETGKGTGKGKGRVAVETGTRQSRLQLFSYWYTHYSLYIILKRVKSFSFQQIKQHVQENSTNTKTCFTHFYICDNI